MPKSRRGRWLGTLLALLTVTGVCTVGPASAAPRTAGTLLEVRDITSRPDAVIAGARQVLSISYLSPDVTGKPIAVRATVFVPKVAPRAGGYRVLGYAHGTAGLGDSCVMTENMGYQGRYDDWLGPWLRDGYLVTATEYAGVGGDGTLAYLHGPTAGRNVVDSVRAARAAVAARGMSASKSFVTTGSSQGGHASLWAGSVAPTYARDLHLVGSIAGAPPVALADYFVTLRPGFPPVAVPDHVTYFSYVLAGLKVARPTLDVDSYLTPLGRTVIRDGASKCYREQSAATRGLTVGQLIARPFDQGPLIPALRAVTAAPAPSFAKPLLIQQGLADPVSFAPLTANYVGALRRAGTDVDFRTYPSGHGLGPWSEVNGLRWSNARRWPA